MNKALFWDFDGTVIHPNKSFLCALCSSLHSNGHDVPGDRLDKFLQTVCSWYTPDISYEDRTGEAWWSALFRKLGDLYDSIGIPSSEREEINTEFRTRVIDHSQYVLYDDAVGALRECIDLGYKNFILSNNFPELNTVADKLGLKGLFSDCFVSSNIGFDKPRREIFKHAFHAAGEPEICLMIGDNPIADIQGAASIGLKTILVHREGEYHADHICKTLSEIPVLLRREYSSE